MDGQSDNFLSDLVPCIRTSMAVLTLSMSRGRSLRQIILGIAIVCPLLTGIWFAIFGGSAIGFEMVNPGFF